jgi:hypothetical protein
VEFLHHPLADLRALYFSFSLFLKMELDPTDDLFNHVDADRPLLASFLQPVEDFKAIERLSPPILLHDQWKSILCPLAGGKSFMAAETFPSASDGIFILSQSGIDDFTLGMITKRTFHFFRSP